MRFSVKTLATSLALLCTASASMATPLASAVVNGVHTNWDVVAPGVLGPNAAADLNTLLAGNLADPGGNVELGSFGALPGTTVSGTLNGQSIIFSSLTIADWTAGGDALSREYILASAASIGLSLTAPQVDLALATFYGTNAWQRVSDPNLSYVYQDDSAIIIGLAGFFDAQAYLQSLFPLVAQAVPPGAQASEVIKVSYAGDTSYLFGFSASPSGYLPAVFSGTYEFSINAVPEPASLALLGIGIAGLAAARRRK